MLVLDASVALSAAMSDVGFQPLGHHDLHAPALLWSEVSSVLSELQWRGEVSKDLAEVARERFLIAPITRRASADLYRKATEMAKQLGWAKTYDAEYVALASMLHVALVTGDARLQRGAGRVIDVLTPDEVASV
ncbi:MAG: type II toxin-antitoxin system VapC family toxin [Actinomycetota bacterium]|nr:type II toxin-antitoxin system VapC family toxin [Actinomycetota bacterium]